MSSVPSLASPSPVELENLGSVFTGFTIATVLYGLTFFQTYIYYSRYPRDLQWMKYLVATLCTLDTVASALISQVLYYYLIVLFSVNMDNLYATTTFCVQYMLSVLLTFISHLFFARRVFQVTGGSRPVALVLVFLSFIALVFGLTASGQMLVERKLSAFGSPKMEITAAISQITGMLADIAAFVVMCYSLRRSRYPELVVPDGVLQTVVTMLVGRGLAFTIVQMAYVCVFIVAPSRLFWIPLQMTASKLYVNTLLGHLNSREVRHGQGLNEEDSLVDCPVPIDGPLSNSIQPNATDVKPPTQSINFTTRHNDAESGGTDLGSRKTCDDVQGNEYTQVSLRSMQSQTDNEVDKPALSE